VDIPSVKNAYWIAYLDPGILMSMGFRSALRELTMPHRVDDDHVLFGQLFQCFIARREA